MFNNSRSYARLAYARNFSAMPGDRKNFREISIPVPWGKIAGKEWGDEHGKPWLGIHGWLDNSGSFDHIAKDWPAGHKLIAIDYPGHGFSSHLPVGMSYYYLESSSYIKRIAKHFGWDKFSLLGHSMGGGISVLFSALYPEKVESLIMIDLIRPVKRNNSEFLSKARESIDGSLNIEEKLMSSKEKVYPSYEDAFRRLYEGSIAMNGENAVTEEAARIILERGVRKSDCGTGWVFTRDLRHRNVGLYGFYEHNLQQMAENIKCPHLLIKAKDFPHYETEEDVENALNIYRKNPHFQYRLVEGNHHLHLNTPEAVLPIIHEFISKSHL